MSAQLWLLAGIVLLVALVALEGKRQERRYGKSRRRGLMRTGLLELQKQLEPERKIEILLDERDDSESDEAAAPPAPPGPPPDRSERR
ncbi:hypothetical protein [Amaricoccus sp.]|uniref:hypothetical protein n=1 Tax=Amaricoccus sp. TaxID=1872485 RepID=UPI001B3F0A62|nr:hypothetical protein [Amaricoccus sp.]MBP7243532.1 hypothetical protein [Amaricoccus sp.]